MMDVRVSIRNGRVEKWASVGEQLVVVEWWPAKERATAAAPAGQSYYTLFYPGSLTSIQVEQA